MIFDVYKECTEIENVHWTNSNVISVFDKKIGFEIGINLEPKNQVRSLTKNDLIERMENTKNHYEKRLQNDLLFIEKKGLSLISPRSKVLDTLKVLVSDISDSEKFKIFNEKNIFPGCKEEFPWIVTDFEASSQLKERIINLEQKNLSKNIAREAGYILDNPIFAPDIDSTTLEEEKTTKSHNDVPGSIEKSDNSPNDVISLIDNTKTISQIENPSNNSKRIIVLSFLSIGMISLLFLYIYRHRLTK